MKRLLFALLILTAASCEKKQCWTCHISETADSTLFTNWRDTVLKYDIGVCDKTKKQIQDFEASAMSTHRLSTDGGVIVEGDFKSVSCD